MSACSTISAPIVNAMPTPVVSAGSAARGQGAVKAHSCTAHQARCSKTSSPTPLYTTSSISSLIVTFREMVQLSQTPLDPLTFFDMPDLRLCRVHRVVPIPNQLVDAPDRPDHRVLRNSSMASLSRSSCVGHDDQD